MKKQFANIEFSFGSTQLVIDRTIEIINSAYRKGESKVIAFGKEYTFMKHENLYILRRNGIPIMNIRIGRGNVLIGNNNAFQLNEITERYETRNGKIIDNIDTYIEKPKGKIYQDKHGVSHYYTEKDLLEQREEQKRNHFNSVLRKHDKPLYGDSHEYAEAF